MDRIEETEKRISGQIRDAEKRLSESIAINSTDIKRLIRDVGFLQGQMSRLAPTSREPQVAKAAGASKSPEPRE